APRGRAWCPPACPASPCCAAPCRRRWPRPGRPCWPRSPTANSLHPNKLTVNSSHAASSPSVTPLLSGVTVRLVLRYLGMETPLHVHNGVLVKIPIWTKHPVSPPPRVIDGVFRGGFRHQMNSWGR